MSAPRMSRGGFLALAGGVLVAGGAACARLLERNGDSIPAPAGPAAAAAGLFGDRAAARRLGRSYLRARPAEQGEQRLTRLLGASGGGWRRALAARDEAALRSLARAHARSDFAAGRLVVVEGWSLALSEARLCALASYA